MTLRTLEDQVGRLLTCGGTAIALMILAAGCGAGSGDNKSDTGAGSNVQRSEKLNAMLPDDVRSRGSVVVATDASYPPMEFFGDDNKTIVGLDPDLGEAIGDLLGITMKFKNVRFDGVIPGLQAGRFDLAMSDMIDKVEREKQVDFVTYLKASLGLLVQKGNPQKLSDLDSLCGKIMALQKGTNAVDVMSPQVEKCKADGRPALTIKLFPSATDAKQALAAGRAAAYMDDAISMAYAAKTSPTTFQTIPGTYAAAPLGIAFPKKSTELRDAVLAAVEELIRTGKYDEQLEKWDAGNVAIEKPEINGAVY